jgi:hypothetical protein
LGYLICRNCSARIDLPHVKHVWDVTPFFLVKCGKCGKTKLYMYIHLRDVRYPTEEELKKRLEFEWATDPLTPDKAILYTMHNIVKAIRRAREEMEKKRRLQLKTPETKHVT